MREMRKPRFRILALSRITVSIPAYLLNRRLSAGILKSVSGSFENKSKSMDSRWPTWSAIAVPPTSPKSFANGFNAGNKSTCPSTRISLCHFDILIEIETEIIGNIRVIISALPACHHLFAEYPRYIFDTED